MRLSTTTITLALGALVAAAPTAAPAKFAIQITAKVDNVPTSLYLAKAVSGAGTTELSKAASCSIDSATNLICEGKTVGATNLGGFVDMYALSGVSGSGSFTDGFSVSEDNVLHWKSKKFPELSQAKLIEEKQGGEAQWGLLRLLGSLSSPQLYSQLGCPGGTHNGVHSELIVGSNKIIPL